jgi:DNA-directed RNA polymerase subunit RPC12/RpoP
MITTIKCPQCAHRQKVDDYWRNKAGNNICGKCHECWYETPDTDVDDAVPCPDFLVETWKPAADFYKALEALKTVHANQFAFVRDVEKRLDIGALIRELEEMTNEM